MLIISKLVSVILVENNLKRIRTEKAITLRKLSSMTGIGKSSLDDFEKGFSDPRISTVLKICKALKIRVEDIFPY